MLLKPTAAVPHVGGGLIQPGEPYYEIMRSWIADGAKLDLTTPRVTKIAVFPVDPVVQRIGAKQQLRVLATYANGEVRDVSREAFLDSANSEVAVAGKAGLITAVRRGEAPILARFEGNYASTTMTVMGDRAGFVWAEPPAYGKIDQLAAAKWKRMKILPSGFAATPIFSAACHLDLTGLPPTADDVRKFLADSRDSRVKRDELIDRLIGNPEFVDYWTNKWADLLQVNRKFLGVEGSVAFRNWIRAHVAANTPYDKFVRAIMTANGSNRENPPAAYFKILRDPAATMENTTQLFLAVRFNCNKCHDHPVRALDARPVLPDGRLFRTGWSECRPGRPRARWSAARTSRRPSRCSRSSPTRARAKSFMTGPRRCPRLDFPIRTPIPSRSAGAPRRVELVGVVDLER